MRRVLWPMFCVCLAVPAFAQDVDLGLGGDASSLLNLPAPRGNTPARGGPARGDAAGRGGNAAPVDRLARLREMFAGANMALTKEQETALTALLNAEIPAMRRTLQARITELQKDKSPG